jgi:hypothetical protein
MISCEKSRIGIPALSGSRIAEKVSAEGEASNLECADNGGALDFLAISPFANSKAASHCVCRRTPNSFSATARSFVLE